MSLARYTDTTATEHDADKRTIATILANDHRGRDHAISSADLRGGECVNCRGGE